MTGLFEFCLLESLQTNRSHLYIYLIPYIHYTGMEFVVLYKLLHTFQFKYKKGDVRFIVVVQDQFFISY